MLPVARRPITSQLSISCTCSTGSTKIRGSPVLWISPSVWMCVPCLMPEAKLHEPLSRKPFLSGTAVPGRVPWPAITGRRLPEKSCLTAVSPRYAAPVPIASAVAMSTQPADGSPYDTFSMTSSELTGSSSAPFTAFGTHIASSPSRCSASTTGSASRPFLSP